MVKSAEELHPQHPPSLSRSQGPPSAPKPALCTPVPHPLASYLRAQLWEPGHREPALPPHGGGGSAPQGQRPQGQRLGPSAPSHPARAWA